MFRWPQTDNPLEWFLEWLIGAAATLFRWLVGALAELFSGRGIFTQWIVISLFVAASLLLLDALTVAAISFPPFWLLFPAVR
jgi:hypothetical protein